MRVEGLWSRVSGLGVRVHGSVINFYLDFWVDRGVGSRVQDSGFRVYTMVLALQPRIEGRIEGSWI